MSMLDLDLGPMVTDLATPTTVPVIRPTAGGLSYDALGQPVEDNESLTLECIWHPTSRDALVREGLDTGKAWMTIYCTTALQIRDTLSLEGDQWTVYDLLPYPGSSLWAGRALRKE